MTDTPGTLATHLGNFTPGTHAGTNTTQHFRDFVVSVLNAHVIDITQEGAVSGTDCTTAIQAALDAIHASSHGGTVYIPPGIWKVASELTYDTATGPPLCIRGEGNASILQASGASNKVLHISGTVGVTGSKLVLSDFQVQSDTSGTCSVGVHLDGLAYLWLHGVSIDGKSKMTTGILFDGSQQGECDGGFITGCNNGIRLITKGGVASNGIEIHSLTFTTTDIGIEVDGIDDAFIHHNHLTSSAIGIKVTSGGAGIASILCNHFELHSTSAITILGGIVAVVGNSIYNDPAITDTGSSASLFEGNIFDGDVTLSSGVTRARVLNNTFASSGDLTDNGVSTTKYGNLDYSGGAIALGAVLYDDLSLTSRRASAGDMLTLNPNSVVSGAWGVSLYGAGANQDIYLRLNGPTLAGTTSGGLLKFLATVGGTQWASLSANGLVVGASGSPLIASGSGSPEGAITAPIGSLYMRTDGGAATSLYVKESGTGNTGWVGK